MIKAYTDLEQSKKLAAGILPLESADHHYVRKTCDFMGNPVDGKWSVPKYGNPNSSHANYVVQNFTNYEKLPCWSLAALQDIIKINYKLEKTFFDQSDYCTYSLYDSDEPTFRTFEYDNPVDACVEMIIKLHEQKLL